MFENHWLNNLFPRAEEGIQSFYLKKEKTSKQNWSLLKEKEEKG